MGLGLPRNETGDFKDIVKYDARAGRMFRIDRADGASMPVEITAGFTAIFDLANIKVGWVRFSEGGAPEWAMTAIGTPLPARPSKDHKQGFRLDIKLAKSVGGDCREFGSAAGCVIGALDKLYDEYAAAPESKAGKLPVVALTGTTMVKSSQGAKTSTNYAPNFTIRQWADRPADLSGQPTTNGTGVAQPQQAGSTILPVVPPPIAQTPANMTTEF